MAAFIALQIAREYRESRRDLDDSEDRRPERDEPIKLQMTPVVTINNERIRLESLKDINYVVALATKYLESTSEHLFMSVSYRGWSYDTKWLRTEWSNDSILADLTSRLKEYPHTS